MPSVDTRTHCPYCSLQCGIVLTAGDRPATLRPQDDFPTNRGGLCSKGWNAATLLDHPQRLLQPLVRTVPGDRTSPLRAGVLGRGPGPDRHRDRHHPGRVRPRRRRLLRRRRADQREGVRLRQVRPGRAADGHDRLQRPLLHVLGGHRRATGRSASTAGCPSRWPTSPRRRRHPAGRVQPGGHHAAGHAVLRRRPGGRGDPHRGRPPAHRHRGRLQPAPAAPLPGTDLALANGLLHLAIKEGLVDTDYIATRTRGFAAVRAGVASYWPDRVERITGVGVDALRPPSTPWPRRTRR